jgi:hypothetical protein
MEQSLNYGEVPPIGGAADQVGPAVAGSRSGALPFLMVLANASSYGSAVPFADHRRATPECAVTIVLEP